MTTQVTYASVIMVVIAGAVLAAIFSPNQVAIVIPLCMIVVVNMLNLLQGTKAAEKVEQVKITAMDTVRKIEEVSEVSKATHMLVNSNMATQLQLNAELSAWKASREPTTENINKAQRAQQLLGEHIRTQGASDQHYPPSGFGFMPPKTLLEQVIASETNQGSSAPIVVVPGSAPIETGSTVVIPPTDVSTMTVVAHEVNISQDVPKEVVPDDQTENTLILPGDEKREG